MFLITESTDIASKTSKNIFTYTIKVRNSVDDLNKIFERAEVNVNVFVDSIFNSYDTNKQQDEKYNLQYTQSVDGLVKSILSNSPGVDGAWFQINADLPFSIHAYNWYQFKDEQFINVKDQFNEDGSADRKITPESDPYYFDAINNQKTTWSDIYVDPDTKTAMMTVSSPINKEGKLIGVVGIDISTDNLKQALIDMQSSLGNSELLLLDKNDNLILSRLPDGSELTKGKPEFLELFKQNKNEPVEYSENTVKKIAILLTLSNDYKIVIAVEERDIFKGLNRIINTIYILITLLIVATAAVLIPQIKGKKDHAPENEDESHPQDETPQE